MMSHLCNRCVRELLILARTWFTFGLPSKPGVTAATAVGVATMQEPAAVVGPVRDGESARLISRFPRAPWGSAAAAVARQRNQRAWVG
jgi:hypothetical protein